MKKLFSVIICLAPAFAYAQSTVDITPNVKSVMLYQNGALVTHEGEAMLEAGKTTVVFHGLPSRIDKQSIQLSSNGDITILSVTSHDDYMSISRNSSKVKKWQDSLDIINEEHEATKNNIAILWEAKDLLKNNRTVGGTQTGTTVMAVKSMYDYYIKQMNIIEDSLRLLNKRQSRCESRMKKIADEIAEWRAKTDTIASDVEASISTDKRQKVGFQLSYLTYDASWSPVYDLRAQDTKHNCQFSYKANISQHTGQDWKDIDLTLSSSNPVVNQTAPTLNTWYLSFAYPALEKDTEEKKPAPNKVYDRYVVTGETISDNSKVDKGISDESGIYTTREIGNTTTATQLSVEFHIDVPYSLPSDDKPHTVEIKNYDLNAIYHYITIPKLQSDVFLLAGITQWEDLNILPGEVNIYYTGAYVGKSYVSPENTSDTLNFSLGMDKRIVVKRTREKDFSSTKWIGSSKTQTFGWTISLHNAQNDSLTMDVFDQIPLPTDKNIIVTPIDLGGASENAAGKLTWHVSLAAGDTKKLTFSYSVKYPKDKTIPNIWQ
jgi:uncharacterized protein (TIGR02231 family)